ncbi:hypothetical protein C8Q77DRAFT_1138350, partial [Trametes polyzona]
MTPWLVPHILDLSLFGAGLSGIVVHSASRSACDHVLLSSCTGTSTSMMPLSGLPLTVSLRSPPQFLSDRVVHAELGHASTLVPPRTRSSL